jgi:hypothetical protein
LPGGNVRYWEFDRGGPVWRANATRIVTVALIVARAVNILR